MTILELDRRRSPLDHTSRVAVLRTIAVRYNELVDPMQSRSKNGGGDNQPLMPKASRHPTVKEFRRLMEEMRIDRHRSLIAINGEDISVRRLRWHINAYYIEARHTTRHVPIVIKRGRKTSFIRDIEGAPITTKPVTRIFRRHGAREDLAESGLKWIADRWDTDRAGEPMLPDELLENALRENVA